MDKKSQRPERKGDSFSTFLVVFAIVLTSLLFILDGWIPLIVIPAISLILIGIAVFRAFSKNKAKRKEEYEK